MNRVSVTFPESEKQIRTRTKPKCVKSEWTKPALSVTLHQSRFIISDALSGTPHQSLVFVTHHLSPGIAVGRFLRLVFPGVAFARRDVQAPKRDRHKYAYQRGRQMGFPGNPRPDR